MRVKFTSTVQAYNEVMLSTLKDLVMLKIGGLFCGGLNLDLIFIWT